MNLPDIPPAFRQPTPEEQPWAWRLLDASGTELVVDPAADPDAAALVAQRFASQGDAESWLGELWRELLDAGARSATLLEADREVYGPMSLEA